jgi:flagella basal body P-ring formation protein FlgA
MLTDRIKPALKNLIVPWSVALLLFGHNVAALAAEEATVTVKPNVSIRHEQILLGQIADIDTDNPVLREQLEACVVGRAPLPGKSREVDGDYLNVKLKQAGIDITRIALQTPDQIEVTRASRTISEQALADMARRFLEAQVPFDRQRVTIKKIQVSQAVVLPPGDMTYQIALPSKTDFVGTVPLAITFLCNGEFAKKVWAIATVEVLQDVIVARKPLGRYQVIGEDDIHRQTLDLAQLPNNVFTTAEEVIGLRAKRTIDAQTVLTPNMIEAPPVINRGDIVVMIAESGGLRISTKAEAREQGGKGERIKVMNIDSRKYVYAFVVDSHTVKVDF